MLRVRLSLRSPGTGGLSEGDHGDVEARAPFLTAGKTSVPLSNRESLLKWIPRRRRAEDIVTDAHGWTLSRGRLRKARVWTCLGADAADRASGTQAGRRPRPSGQMHRVCWWLSIFGGTWLAPMSTPDAMKPEIAIDRNHRQTAASAMPSTTDTSVGLVSG